MSTSSFSPNSFRHIAPMEAAGPFIALMTTRQGGISLPPYDSLNMSYKVGDETTFVDENRWRLANYLDCTPDRFIALSQIHSDIIYDQTCVENSGQPGDGHFLDQPGLFAVIGVADCIPLFLADPQKKVIGVIHAGWRGLHQSIVAKAVIKMVNTYGCEPGNILAVVGPSLGPCHYEVQRDVIDQFEALLGYECIFFEQKGAKYFLNMWSIAHFQLINQGLYSGHIYLEHACTMCQPDLYFSHRGSGGRTGRMWAVVGLKA